MSEVTPAFGFLGRTVDLTIAGNGTAWTSATTVAFADAKIKVNKVTVASPTGLLVNVTIGQDATPAATTDVAVTDSGTTEIYKGAFEVKAPLSVTIDQTGGVPQGGLATVHVVMLDLSTPFDAATAAVTLSSADLGAGPPTVTDYALDFSVEADVLAKAGGVDLDLTSGAAATLIDSKAKSAFSIATRAPKALSSSAAATGTIATVEDTALFQYAPSAATQRFVQFSASSMSGAVTGTVIPKSGKYADAVSFFSEHFGQGTTSTDPFYVIISDSNGLFGPGPTPADLSVVTLDVACTAGAETAETAAANNDTFATAQAVTTLPALVTGKLGHGAVDQTADLDFYAITVTGAPKKIHVATGGDAQADTILAVLDSSGTTALGTSDDADYQEDLTVDAPTNGTYYVSVGSSSQSSGDPAHATYQLFVEVK